MCGVPDSFAGFPTQTSGWRLSSWLTVAVFTSPSDSSPSGPITLRVPDSCAGFRLICGVPDSNLWLATLVVTHRCSFHPPSDSSPSGPITLRVPDSCAGFRTHLRGSRLKPLVGDSRRDSPLQFSPPLVIPLLQAPSPLGFLTHVRGSDSFAGFPTQTSGWRLSSWLTVAVFTPLVIPLLQAPSPLGFLTHVRGSGLICGVPDSNLWLATLVVTHRCSFHPLVIPLLQAPSPLVPDSE